MSSETLQQAADFFVDSFSPLAMRKDRNGTFIRPTKVDIISDDEENTSSVQPADAEIVFKPTVLRGHSDSGHCSAEFLEKYTPTRVNGFRRAKITDSLIDVSIDEVSQLQLSPSPSSDALIKDDEFVYPLVRQSSNGICILLSKDLFVETTLDKSIRVVHEGRYSVFVNGHGTASSIIHPTARLLHNQSSICGRFGDKLAVLGNTGILFTMDRLPKAYWINNTSKGTSTISLENLHLPELTTDCIQFCTDAVTGKSEGEEDKKIADTAVYSKKSDGTLIVQINGMRIRYSPDGDLTVAAGHRQMNCAEGTVQVRTNLAELTIIDTETASIRYGQKRVHVSISGMLVSDGNNCSTMDTEGRIILSS